MNSSKENLLKNESAFYFGYPEVAVDPNLIKAITPFLPYHINNVGDPWHEGNWKMHAKQEEQDVLQFMANFYDIPNSFWGHITTGGTEGNLVGSYLGRKFLEKEKKEIVFITSSNAHYSLFKIADIMQVPLTVIECDPTGKMDILDFKSKIDSLKDVAVLVNLTIGTTMTGAIDPFEEIIFYLKQKSIPFYVHADAAFHGGFYPFMSCYKNPFIYGVDSISISGHKFFGTLRPCGIFLTHRDVHQDIFYNTDKVSYINCLDSTITGSRDGLLALLFQYILREKGIKGLKKSYTEIVQKAQFLAHEFKKLNWPNLLHLPEQPIVVFEKPSSHLCQKYQLAVSGSLAHVVLKNHISVEHLEIFLSDMQSERS